MADEPQPPAPAPQQDHQTLVLTDPPPEKHHTLLWSLCILAVTLMTGGFVYAYWQFGAPEARVPDATLDEQDNSCLLYKADNKVLCISDPQFFAVFNYGYTENADRVYFSYHATFYELEIVEGADPATFSVFDYVKWAHPDAPIFYARDQNNVYRNSKHVVEADPATFRLIRFSRKADCVENEETYFNVCELTGYAADENYVYNVYNTGEIVEGADPETFVVLNKTYARDKNNVYYHFTPEDWFPIDVAEVHTINGVDVSTFETFMGQVNYDAQDKNHKYLEGKIVATTTSQDSIATTTVVLDSTGHPSNYETDGTTIYYVWPDRSRTSVVGVDVTTFSIVPYENHFRGSPYGKDKNAIYYNNLVLSGANPNTFKSYSSEQQGGSDAYGKDEDQVWFWGYLIAEADAQTFIVFESLQPGGFHAQDKNHKYYQDNIIE